MWGILGEVGRAFRLDRLVRLQFASTPCPCPPFDKEDISRFPSTRRELSVFLFIVEEEEEQEDVDANAEEEDLMSMMLLLVPLLLSRKKGVRSTALFTNESTFD